MSVGRIINVSNRLPVTVGKKITRSSGGLVSALEVVQSDYGMKWVGWPGCKCKDIGRRRSIEGELVENYGFVPVFLNKKEIDNYYHGFSNSSLWPLLHYRANYMRYESDWWYWYKKVNEDFAEVILEIAQKNDLIWIHDYHLMLLPKILKRAKASLKIGFFLHTPFPSYEIFRCHPNRIELLEGVLGSDLIGFHTFGYMRHFRSSAVRLLNIDAGPDYVPYDDSGSYLGVFPIGCNVQSFQKELGSSKFEKRKKYFEKIYGGKKIVLSVERLDYSKGIPSKLAAVEKFLERWKGKEDVVFIFISVPTRNEVREYRQLRNEVESKVGHINGRFSTVENVPVHFIHKSIAFTDLCALYSLADVAMVTPFVDGMNLVAKEYVACHEDKKGVLILSEFAGAADELFKAVLVNPYDVNNLVDGLTSALSLEDADIRRRMEGMYKRVIKFDSRYWAKNFIENLIKIKPIEVVKEEKKLTERKILLKAKKSKKAAVFLDYDGTLREIQKDAKTASPSLDLERIFERFDALKDLDVFVISGRFKDDLQRWMGKYGFTLIAEHGYAYRAKGRRQWELFDKNVDLSWRDQVIDILDSFVGSTPGSFVEAKASSIVWHYRRSDPEFGKSKALQLISHLTEVLSNFPVEVHHGKKIVEVSSIQINKGRAVTHFTKNKKYDMIVCAGDDQTDESMFRLQDEKIVKIKVCKGDTLADIVIESPVKFRAFLTKFANSFDGQK